MSIWTPARWDRAERANERNLYWAEEAEWGKRIEMARQHGWPMPVGGGLIKARYEISAGLQGRESGWDLDTVPIADFGNVNAAGAVTIRSGLNTFPLVNPAPAVTSSPDPLPYQLSVTSALNASRAAGTSTNPLAILVGVYVVHATIAAPPTVYNPAGTTMNLKVLSSALTVTTTATPPTLATLNVATATNFVDSVAISAPTERQVSTPTGTLLTTASGIFNGDSHFVEMAMTGAVNHQGTLLYVEIEVI
jgi:hypothetical protein